MVDYPVNSIVQTKLLQLEEIPQVITVKEEYAENIQIQGYDIYIKVDATHGPYISIDLFDDMLDYDREQYYFLNIDNPELWLYTGGTYTLNQRETGTNYIYNTYIVGDICLESNNYGEINMKDVMYLRKAIVGYDMTSSSNLEDGSFEMTTTDVNLSNSDDHSKLGDIGDVISIRRRILNDGKWDW